MKKNNWIIIFLLGISFIFVSPKIYEYIFLYIHRLSLQIDAAQIAAPTISSQNLEVLTLDKANKLQEIDSWESDDSTIVTMAETPDRLFLQVVYSDGILRRWNFNGKSVTSRLDLGSANKSSTNFDKTGRWIATSGVNSSVGYQVFDTETGKSIDCYQAINCPGGNNFIHSGQLLIPSGNLLIRYDSNFRFLRELNWTKDSLYDSSASSNDCLFQNGFDDFHTTQKILRVTVSSSEKYIAYAIENGIICIRELGEITGIDITSGKDDIYLDKSQSSFKRLRFRLPEEQSRLIALEFDVTNHWLAALTSKELIVWNLDNFYHPKKIYFPVLNGTSLSFDRSGKILALGTDEKLLLFSVSDSTQIAEIRVPLTTSIYFTRDNRMLILGDSEGVIHLWGVAQDTP